MIFVDTNIFFYARDDRLAGERDRCRDWLIQLGTRRIGRANLQVANEFVHVALRKLPDVSSAAIFRMSDDILAWGGTPLTMEAVSSARDICLHYRYSWWDCLLLASALELGCTHFLSEDLQDGQRIEADGKALTIVDPFAHSPQQILRSR